MSTLEGLLVKIFRKINYDGRFLHLNTYRSRNWL